MVAGIAKQLDIYFFFSICFILSFADTIIPNCPYPPNNQGKSSSFILTIFSRSFKSFVDNDLIIDLTKEVKKISISLLPLY